LVYNDWTLSWYYDLSLLTYSLSTSLIVWSLSIYFFCFWTSGCSNSIFSFWTAIVCLLALLLAASSSAYFCLSADFCNCSLKRAINSLFFSRIAWCFYRTYSASFKSFASVVFYSWISSYSFRFAYSYSVASWFCVFSRLISSCISYNLILFASFESTCFLS